MESLQAQLNERRDTSRTKRSPEVLAIMDEATNAIADLPQNSLQVNQPAPDFTLPNLKGESVTLSSLLKKNPIVLTFYRGGWCPYCNMQLRAYQAILPEIEALGAKLVAVSPQTPDESLSTAEKDALSFEVLSDVGNVIARQYGLVFRLTDDLRDLYLSMNIDLEHSNGTDAWELPMPGTFIIQQDGTAIHAFVPADYTQREEPENILNVLRSIVQG